jgi:hypothetical protein
LWIGHHDWFDLLFLADCEAKKAGFDEMVLGVCARSNVAMMRCDIMALAMMP